MMGAHVLLIEDDPNLGFILQEHLELHGYRVERFPHRQSAQRRPHRGLQIDGCARQLICAGSGLNELKYKSRCLRFVNRT
jgi:DNA-binding NtrC family response regulator